MLGDFKDAEIANVLEIKFQKYGFDFRDYSQAHLKRRIRNRMLLSNVSNLHELQSQIVSSSSFAEGHHFHISQVKKPLIFKFLIGIQEHIQQKFSSHILTNSILTLVVLLMLISGCQKKITGAFESDKNHSTKGRVMNAHLTGKVRRIDSW